MLALVTAQEGDLAQASGLFGIALAELWNLGDRLLIIFNLMGLAEIVSRQGRRGEAARLLGGGPGARRNGRDRVRHGWPVTYAPFIARASLAESAFAAAWAEGRALPLDRAIDYALAMAGTAGGRPSTPAPPRPAVETLTRREREVVLLVARGQSDREIAAVLSISPATAGTHVHNILAKLDLRSRHQVVAWAAAQGLVPSTDE